ncbi:methyltransferase domain-containing protein [Nitratireductor sp. XY-223]|uniref:methyltransferase domain-containing protein n=1 Tax=Nitratireductor sp. XY-223 TaxID=2561926 RepID=UPI00145A51E3|nr:methyltransferase domain-containing protein [Nitratireductor sp. XY-223]
MSDEVSGRSEYIHGSSPEEQQRLSLLNDILNESCLRELGLRPGETVLDLGSGLGQFTRLIARTVGSKGHVVGIERDRDQISQANRLAEGSEEPKLVEFRKGDALELPLSESEWGTFDVAHARFLLEHVPRPELVIAQMVRSVRPGGRVFVCDDDHDDFRPWPEPPGFPALWQAYVRSYERLGNDPYVGRRLVSLLGDGGLTSIRNTCVFFGGCAGNERFEAVADNLIGALEGARDPIVSGELLDEVSFNTGMDGLRQWKAHPSAALWYSACCAEGIVPN